MYEATRPSRASRPAFLAAAACAALAEQGDGLVQVAAGLLEGALAVHEAGAGALAELLDRVGADRRLVSHRVRDPSSCWCSLGRAVRAAR